MLANWVKQTTSTTGTGTITLDGSPASGFIAFSSAYVTGQRARYVIEDGSNRETGEGILTSGSSWTLTREVIHETLASGTLTRFPGTGITLSGSATVMVAPVTQMDAWPPMHAYSSTIEVISAHLGAATTTQVTTDSAIMMLPFFIPVAMAIATAAINVTTGATSSKIRIGIYDVINWNASAGAVLLAQTGDISTGTTGVKTGTFDSVVKITEPKWIAIGIIASGAPTLRATTNTSVLVSPLSLNGTSMDTPMTFFTDTAQSGWSVMPSTVDTQASANFAGSASNVPRVVLRA